MRVLARELRRVGARVRVRRTVGVTFERDGGHRDDWTHGELLLQFVVPGLAWRQSEPPPVVVDHDLDVIGVVEGPGAAFKRHVVEVPLW